MSEQFSVLEILKKSTEFLLKKGISTAKSDSEWILCEFLKIDKIDIYLDNGKITDSKIIDLIRSAVVRRAKREPLQHITGNVDFCSINLKCDTRALIPRYETEQLVDIVAKNIPLDFQGKIIDFGTGSGAIAIALAKQFEKASFFAYDKSEQAISLAKENAEVNKCSNQIVFRSFDWQSDSFTFEKSDVLVSNPPYLSKEEWCLTEPEVKNYDPFDALVSQDKGYSDLKRILEISPCVLKKTGMLAFEMGHLQAEHVQELAMNNFKNITIEKDFSGKRRYLLAWLA
jgi:release factor glutamine methyltransferase